MVLLLCTYDLYLAMTSMRSPITLFAPISLCSVALSWDSILFSPFLLPLPTTLFYAPLFFLRIYLMYIHHATTRSRLLSLGFLAVHNLARSFSSSVSLLARDISPFSLSYFFSMPAESICLTFPCLLVIVYRFFLSLILFP